MFRESYTILVFGKKKQQFLQLEVTKLKLFLIVSIVITSVITSVINIYVMYITPYRKDEIERLKAEKDRANRLVSQLESKLAILEEKLVTYEKKTRKLAIIAGINVDNILPLAGIGGSAEEDEIYSIERLNLLETALGKLEHLYKERKRYLSSIPSLFPTKGVIVSRYGIRIDPFTRKRAFHRGIDIEAAPKTPVLAAADGVVIEAGRLGNLGRAVVIKHGPFYRTRYAHLSRYFVKKGQKIKAGDIIGLVGTTGRSTGYHLHFEVINRGKFVNPENYVFLTFVPSGSEIDESS